jgi:hypothetical protein
MCFFSYSFSRKTIWFMEDWSDAFLVYVHVPLNPFILRRTSYNSEVRWLQSPFCQPFPTLIHCQSLCIALDALSGLAFICPGLVNSDGSCKDGTRVDERQCSGSASTPPDLLSGAQSRRTEAIKSQTWLWRLSKGASTECSIKTSRI